MRGWRRRFAVTATTLAALSVAVVAVAPRPGAAASDTTAPELRQLTFSPATVDTSAGAVAVTVDARLTDDASGPSNGGRLPLSRIDLVGPGATQRASAYLSVAQRTGGTALDGTYRTTITLPWHAEPGRWSASASLVDAAGNTRTMTTAALAGAGLGTGLDQTGPGDTTAPSLVSLSVSPAAIDTSAGSASIAVTARLTDDRSGISSGSGVAPSQVVLRGPSGAHRVRATLDISRRAGGDALDATFVVPVTVPRWSEQGTWTVEHATLYDAVGNVAAVTAPGVSFAQTGIGDVVAPRVAAFTLSSTDLDVRTAAANLTMRVRLTDDRSGVSDGLNGSPSEVVFRSPSGAQEIVGRFGAGQRTSGTALDGWYEARVSVPTTTEPGTWQLRVGRPVDQATNAAALDATAWQAAGFAATIAVASNAPPGPTPTTDATASTSAPPTSVLGSTTTEPSTSSTAPGGSTTTATVAGATTTTAPDGASTTTTPDGGTTTTIDGSGTTVPGGTSTTGAPPTTVGGAGGTTTTRPRTTTTRPPAATARVDGYWFAASDGTVQGFGGAAATSAVAPRGLGAAVVGMAATPTGRGYWIVTSSGDVRAFGDARLLGSMAGRSLWEPVVGMAATPTGRGYWLVARDGGIFSFGDARFFGSTGGMRLNQPIVGMTATATGRGYWFVAADGGIFAFGDARFYGSTGALRLNQPVVGMTAAPTGRGYWLVARDGGICALGDAPFYGSTGSLRLVQPIVGMAATPAGRGYWFVAADGGIFAYGDARFYGSVGGAARRAPVVAMAARVTR